MGKTSDTITLQEPKAFTLPTNEWNWFKRHRLEWINETIRIYGFINREHIMKKFDISLPQASMDMRDVMNECQWIRYDTHTKRFIYEVPQI